MHRYAKPPDLMTAPQEIIRLVEVEKSYKAGQEKVPALRGVSLSFRSGSFTAVMGPSGSGKSTLLHCAAGLDTPSAGAVFLGETNLTTLSDAELARLRRDQIGFVFQAFNLLPSLSAAKNIELPLRLAKRKLSQLEISDALKRVGLADRSQHRPSEMSGGEQQRVAIARALVVKPAVLFADEPTGALDSAKGRQILDMLRALVDDDGQTIVMVTHDPVAASRADRVVFLRDGLIAGELERPSSEKIMATMVELES